MRSPGMVDGTEALYVPYVGQQVSVAGARTVLGRIAAALGTTLAEPVDDLVRVFPSAAGLAEARMRSCRCARPQGRAARGVPAYRQRRHRLDAGTDRDAVRRGSWRFPGIGPWTAEYVAMRALGDPDAFPATDLGIRTRWHAWESPLRHARPSISPRHGDHGARMPLTTSGTHWETTDVAPNHHFHPGRRPAGRRLDVGIREIRLPLPDRSIPSRLPRTPRSPDPQERRTSNWTSTFGVSGVRSTCRSTSRARTSSCGLGRPRRHPVRRDESYGELAERRRPAWRGARGRRRQRTQSGADRRPLPPGDRGQRDNGRLRRTVRGRIAIKRWLIRHEADGTSA